MAEYFIQDTTLTAIANAIRDGDGTTEPIAVTDIGSRVGNLIKTLNCKFKDSGITTVTSEIFPNITKIGREVFSLCEQLTTVDLPNVVEIGESTFGGCSNLTSINLPNLVTADMASFIACTSLETLDLPKLENIRDNTIQPGLSASGTFSNCTNLKTLRVPMLKIVPVAGFVNCKSLTELILPSVQGVGMEAFVNCDVLAKVDFSSLVAINMSSFKKCPLLTTVIIRTNSVPDRSTSALFKETPINDGTGYIYVPASLVDAYKTHTKWRDVASQIRAIEDYPEICNPTE